MPTINNLTDAKCRAAKPTEKARKIFDGGGLYLFVSPTGAKTWRLSYRVAGKPKTISFGPYPEVTLAQAREKRDAAKGALRSGVDPMSIKRPHAGAQQLSFAEANLAYWATRKDLSDGYRKTAHRSIELHLCPVLGNRPLRSIERADLLAPLNVVDGLGMPILARRIRLWTSHLYDWAIEQDMASTNPAAAINPSKAFSRVKQGHYAALGLRDLPDFLARLQMEKGTNRVLACRLLALTWARTNELRQMKWEQLEDDFWRVPAIAMKRGHYHLVPLSKQALEVIAILRDRRRGNQFVFPSEWRVDRPIAHNSILELIYRMGYKGRMTGHGWRAVGSTWANERGYNTDAIERQLAHAPDDRTRAAYNRAEYLDERRRMLQDWADYLDSLQADAGLGQSGQ